MKSYLIEIQNGNMVAPVGYSDAQTEDGTAKAAFYYHCSIASGPDHRNDTTRLILLAEDGHHIKEEIFTPPAANNE